MSEKSELTSADPSYFHAPCKQCCLLTIIYSFIKLALFHDDVCIADCLMSQSKVLISLSYLMLKNDRYDSILKIINLQTMESSYNIISSS